MLHLPEESTSSWNFTHLSKRTLPSIEYYYLSETGRKNITMSWNLKESVFKNNNNKMDRTIQVTWTFPATCLLLRRAAHLIERRGLDKEEGYVEIIPRIILYLYGEEGCVEMIPRIIWVKSPFFKVN